jgi:hypothetical protein
MKAADPDASLGGTSIFSPVTRDSIRQLTSFADSVRHSVRVRDRPSINGQETSCDERASDSLAQTVVQLDARANASLPKGGAVVLLPPAQRSRAAFDGPIVIAHNPF